MSDAFIVDLTHYLTEDGRVPDRLPPICRFMGAIVEEVSALRPDVLHHLALRCRRRPDHVPCPGRIQAVHGSIDDGIDWHCPICDDHGGISNWQDTPWDKSRDKDRDPDSDRHRDRDRRPAGTRPASLQVDPGFTVPAARAWARVPAHLKIRLLNNVWCGHCRGTCSIAVSSGTITRGDLLLQGTCTKCGGPVARVIENAARP